MSLTQGNSDKVVKTCTKCHETKCLNNFTTNKRNKDGKSPWCHLCSNLHSREYRKLRLQTPTGKAAKAWDNISSRCCNKSGQSPEYANVELKMSRKKFIDWAIPEYEKFMYLNPGVQPSVDRIDPDGHYEINNIRIISMAENCERSMPIEFMKLLDRNLQPYEFASRLSDVVKRLLKMRKIGCNQFLKIMHTTGDSHVDA